MNCIKSRLPTYEIIDQMIEEELKQYKDIFEISPIALEPNKKYGHLIKFDFEKKLDNIDIIRSEVTKAVRNEIFKACVDVIGSMNKLIKYR